MSRSQLRLDAITGSLTQIDDVASLAQPAALIPVEDLNDILGQFAGAVRRIHGADDFTNSQAGVFAHSTSVFSGSVVLKDVSGAIQIDIGEDGTVSGSGDLSVGGKATVAAEVDAGTLKGRDLTASHVLFASASGQVVGESSLTYDAVDDILTMVTGVAYDFAINHQLIIGDSGVIYNNANDLFLNDEAGRLFFFDVGCSGSIAAGGANAWSDTNGIALSNAASEWNNYKALFGESSLLAAIVQVGVGVEGTGKFVKKMGSDVPAASIVASPLSITGGITIGDGLDFTVLNDIDKQVDVFANGVLLTSGTDGDYVVSGTDTVGFRFDISSGDVISVVVR
jgi:hypothetical protein